MRVSLLPVFVGCVCLISIACDSGQVTAPKSTPDEFVVAGANLGFNIVNIHTNVTRTVDAVVQLSDTVYLPVYSWPPSFNHKVVNGVFVPDTTYFAGRTGTIFHVTRHVRDTTLATVGQ